LAAKNDTPWILEWFASAVLEEGSPDTADGGPPAATGPASRTESAPEDPESAQLFALLRLARMHGGLDADSLRASNQASAQLLHGLSPAAPVEYEVEIPGPASSLRACVHAPGGREEGPFPIVVYFHGGGYIAGSPESHIHVTRQVCHETESVVVCVDYRLAPEHPFPAPIDDCLATTRWVRRHARELGGDPNRIALAGNSAGANAAVTVAMRLRDLGAPMPRAIALLCPWLDLTFSSESFKRLAPSDPAIDIAASRYLITAYAAGHDVRNPLISPIFGKLHALPRTLVIVAELDPLYCDGQTFVERARAAGVEAEMRAFRGMPHDFAMLPGTRRGAEALDCAFRFLRAELAPQREHADACARMPSKRRASG